MTNDQTWFARWREWKLEIRVWKLFLALLVAAVLAFWFSIVHQKDEILALIRSDVAADAAGQRIWSGTFVNTNGRTLRDVGVTVNFLDAQDRVVGQVEAESDELPFSARLDLQAPLPPNAMRLRIHSVQWRMGDIAALMGPFRMPWEFGYLMAEPGSFGR